MLKSFFKIILFCRAVGNYFRSNAFLQIKIKNQFCIVLSKPAARYFTVTERAYCKTENQTTLRK